MNNTLISCCGLDCSKCEARIATINNDDKLREEIAKKWSQYNNVIITKDMINCVGCNVDGVKTPFCKDLCEIRKCAMNNKFKTCSVCKKAENCSEIAKVIGNNEEARKNILGK